MHEQSTFQILAESDNGYIGVCECCKEYNFVYRNILLIFSEDELLRFCKWILAYRYHNDTYLPLAHGRTRVYTSPLSNLFLSFHEHELDELDQLFSETKLIIDARSLVNQPKE